MKISAVARRARRLPLVAVALCAAAVSPSAAMAFGPVGADPTANVVENSYPSACWQAPTGDACEAAAVTNLQRSRAALGQPAYVLPADFGTLPGTSQALILTNLDRALYGLPPVMGLVSSLSADAAHGVTTGSDPSPSGADWTGWTANWAEGMPNMVAAYQFWMYDDGYGSGNIDCQSPGASGCWGHRHDILMQFDSVGPLVMGAATGFDSSGTPGYAMLLESLRASSAPSYTYSWAQAVADGAGGPGAVATPITSAPSVPSAPPASVPSVPSPGAPVGGHVTTVTARFVPVVLRVAVRGHRVSGVVHGGRSGAAMSCALGVLSHGRYVRERFVACSSRFSYVRVPRGVYRLRVRVGRVTVTRYLVVR